MPTASSSWTRGKSSRSARTPSCWRNVAASTRSSTHSRRVNAMANSQQLRGLGDLLARYGKIFSLAWQDRKVLDGPAYRRDEAAFLPAALALTASPPSPIPRVTLWLLISFLVIALTWAIFGQIDIVATAQG